MGTAKGLHQGAVEGAPGTWDTHNARQEDPSSLVVNGGHLGDPSR